MNKGMTTLAVIGTTSASVAAGVVFVLSLVTPQINDLSKNQYDDHTTLTNMSASVSQIPSINEKVTQATEDAAVVKELVKLMSPRFQIDAEAVETRVIQESSTSNVQAQ